MDKNGANKACEDYLNAILLISCVTCGFFYQIIVRQIKYLNTVIEQNHRAVKRITRSMMGFKACHSAAATVARIKLHHILRKDQLEYANGRTVYEQFYDLAA